MATLTPTKSHFIKTDSLDQFSYHPVLGINVMGQLVPIQGRVLLGGNLIQEGLFYAGYTPDACFFRDECCRQETTTEYVYGFIKNVEIREETLTDLDGRASRKVTPVNDEREGTFIDGICTPLAIANSRQWWVGTTFYQPKTMVFPNGSGCDKSSSGYPGTHTHTYCEIRKEK